MVLSILIRDSIKYKIPSLKCKWSTSQAWDGEILKEMCKKKKKKQKQEEEEENKPTEQPPAICP